MAHNNLGIVLVSRGRVAEAIEQYEHALKSEPDFADAHNNLGSLLAPQGKLDEGIRHIERALQLRPDFPIASENLNKALAQRRAAHPTTTPASNRSTRP